MKKALAFASYIFGIVVFLPFMTYAACTVTTTTGTTADVSAFGHSSEQLNAVLVTPACSGFVSSLTFRARAVGSPAQPVTVAFYSTTGSDPDAQLYESSAVAVGAVGDYQVDFLTPASLTASADYWVVFKTTSFNGSNFYSLSGDVSGGVNRAWTGSAWSNDYPDALPNLTFDVVDTPPPAPDLGGATSTVEQMQSNLGSAFYIFFIAFFGMVWLLSKNR